MKDEIKAEVGDNTFTIENGRVLRGYPREQPDEKALAWPDEETRGFEAALFEANAHFLFANREKIFADSRMFLAPVNVMSGGAYVGAFTKPILGTYLEWWVRDGKDDFPYFVSGSPLSGTNVSKAIAKDGSLVSLCPGQAFNVLALPFQRAHKRYLEERKRFEAYSLLEVIMRLKGETPSYADVAKSRILERREAVLEKRVEALELELSEAKRCCQSWKDKYKQVLHCGCKEIFLHGHAAHV